MRALHIVPKKKPESSAEETASRSWSGWPRAGLGFGPTRRGC